MKLRIESDEAELSPALRASVDSHIRIALGSRSVRFRSVRVSFVGARNRKEEICCRISVYALSGDSRCFEEIAPSLEEALEWAVWRLTHSLDRQALRTLG